ncbi:MAG TPA: OsmC family protein [Candidatus Binatia bacterium]|nr:OsmC family protein [Candidatus Binatia bacterium]
MTAGAATSRPDRRHRYHLTVSWTGNLGSGTRSYAGYSRDHEVSGEGKPAIAGSSDPSFRGDPGRWSPEELTLAALSQCHMLWYLHLCSRAGIVVTGYVDMPEATLVEHPDGSGEFVEATLRPRVTLGDPSRAAEAAALHGEAHDLCFVARSVNFPVSCVPLAETAASA